MPLRLLHLYLCPQVLAKSLQQLLDYDGDVQADFMRTFRIDYTDVFGTVHNHNLKEGGDQVELTSENRQVYGDKECLPLSANSPSSFCSTILLPSRLLFSLIGPRVWYCAKDMHHIHNSAKETTV